MVLGQISLNLSFLMYLFLYLPQVIHNQKQITLQGLSKWMHTVLYSAYFLDSIYGYANDLPWQYRMVSAIGWGLLNIQHLQFIQYFKRTKQSLLQYSFYGIWWAFILILIWLIYYHQSIQHGSFSSLGYIAQVGFVIAFVPQIRKSKQLKTAQSLSVVYILLCLFLAILDCISAWQFAWGWPNQLGSSLIIVLTIILLMQYIWYPKNRQY